MDKKIPFSFFQLLAIFNFHFSILIFSSCHSPTNEIQNQQFASLSDSTVYVGMNTCRQCHQGIYETFIQTGMGKSFDIASHSKSSASFDSQSILYDSIKNLFYHPFWKNDSLYVKEFRLEDKDTMYERTERISYIIGSGQHTNSHLLRIDPVDTGNGFYLYQAPATFYTQKHTWDLPPGFEKGFNSRFSRKIEVECMSCHNGYPDIVAGSENKYISIPNGIDCERCHGPGSEHVRQKQLGILIDTTKEIDYTIVNPAKLPVALQMDICQRCHIQGNAVLNEGKTFLDFRPGMQLSDVMNVFMPVYKGDEDAHIMASHAERLKMSKCFITSVEKADQQKTANKLKPYKNALTCVTCHNPHVSVKATGSNVFNHACLDCHSKNESLKPGNSKTENRTTVLSIQNSECTADPEKRKAANDNCVSCHMPKNSTTDIPHVSTTDHYIRKPIDRSSVQKIRELVGLACINNPKPPEKAIAGAYLSYFEKFGGSGSALDSAKKNLPDGTENQLKSNFDLLVRHAYLQNNFSEVIKYAERAGDEWIKRRNVKFKNEEAWTAYRIGESYLTFKNTGRAVLFFQLAVELLPYQLEFRNKLGSAQLESGKNEEARKNFQFILFENSKFASAWNNMGYLTLSVDRNIQQADSCFDRALELDPDNEPALLNKAGVCLYLEKKTEARKLLQRIIRINPKNEKAKKQLELLSMK